MKHKNNSQKNKKHDKILFYASLSDKDIDKEIKQKIKLIRNKSNWFYLSDEEIIIHALEDFDRVLNYYVKYKMNRLK